MAAQAPEEGVIAIVTVIGMEILTGAGDDMVIEATILSAIATVGTHATKSPLTTTRSAIKPELTADPAVPMKIV